MGELARDCNIILEAEQPADEFNPVRAEQALWRAVITQALMDAASKSKKMEAKYEKSQALCWLTGFSEDFKTVCELANLAPDYVRRSSIAALERDCKWRAERKHKKHGTSKTILNNMLEKKAKVKSSPIIYSYIEAYCFVRRELKSIPVEQVAELSNHYGATVQNMCIDGMELHHNTKNLGSKIPFEPLEPLDVSNKKYYRRREYFAVSEVI